MLIYKMYNTWKKTGVFRGGGRPSLTSVAEIHESTSKSLRERTNNSNTFKLDHMKNMIVDKKKEVVTADGLDLTSI